MRTTITAAAALLTSLGFAQAQQQDIEWKQIIDVPKGMFIPRSSGDILGIEIGDGYIAAKKKLDALLAESAPGSSNGIKEERRVFRMSVPGASTVVAAAYVAKLVLTRQVKGSGANTSEESIHVYLTAPSSGQQVVAIQRYTGWAEADQPRLSDILAQLKAKMGSDPQTFPSQSGTVLRYQYDEAKPFAPARPSPITCQTSLHVFSDANQLPNVNQSGNCDGLLEISVTFGISRDHAKSMVFTLNDNERLKANMTADFKYVNAYIRDLQNSTRGTVPKL
ncbi:hypothetical protein [Afipia clevelandensis]|uniref:Uncharacterized protein n=1 Tax=Afipia clevelandensis ATCC 49720 TaxID=883079 RepID=K8P1P7_9BRAD|nr:hypothetical protein [Afipia clevelandensis]EKS35366.1 hypothetical protein HMPREF9696_02638 [Afipia clevelandensis ATCC 49720]